MTLSRRTVIRLGLGAGAVPLLDRVGWAAQVPRPSEPAEANAVAGLETLRARPLPLSRVRLQGGPLQHAQELDARYLLSLEPDRMLAYYRERAGLPRKAEPYGGWDGDGRNLTGHIAGHHLSAVSLMWLATGDARFKERADYIVGELKLVQDRNGDGYLSALQGGRRAFGALARGEIRSAAFDLNGEWSPWYTLHKTFAGLRDAYRHTGNRTALAVETRFAEWAEGILSALDDAQCQQMLNTEFGGMNQVLVDLYADTGDERWLKLSYAFEHRAFIEPLERHQDDLAGKHGNTQIPKLMGSVDRYTYTGRPADLLAASFFWDRVAHHHSFATGGHGTDEYFGPPDQLSDRVDGRTAESCNVYNMLKLTRRLFALWPDPHYADFQERALFNHVLGSIDPQDGRMCYMVPVGRGVTHEYQDMLHDFTCCVGTGMENHALHGDGLYYEAGDQLWVNVYAPSTAEWSEAGVRLRMDTDFPEGEAARLTLDLDAPRELTLSLRRPYWVGDGFAVRVNGAVVAGVAGPESGPGGAGTQVHPPAGSGSAGSAAMGGGANPAGQQRPRRGLYDWPFPVSTYIEIKRTWRSGDTVEISLPKTLRLEPTPDNPDRVAILWGPLVLAGDLGPEPSGGPSGSDTASPQRRPRPTVPVLVAADRNPATWLQPVAGDPGRFRTAGAGREANATGRVHDVDFVPFYRLPRRTYALYWDLFTPPAWAKRRAEFAAEAERQRRLEAATVAWLQPGEVMFERRFNYQSGADAVPQRIMGRPGRHGGSWFSYELPVESNHPMALIATYFSDDRRATPASFDILIDGQRIAEQEVDRSQPRRFYDVTYSIPGAVVAGKDHVTVRFQAKPGSQIATVFGVRIVRK